VFDLMDEPQTRSDQMALAPLPEAISWQYIVLTIALALLFLAIAGARIPVDRARRVVDLNDLELTQVYESAAVGVRFSHPEGWIVTPIPERFIVANFDAVSVGSDGQLQSVRGPEEPGQVAIEFRNYARQSGFSMKMTPAEIVQQFLAANRSGMREISAVTDVTVGGVPGARAHFTQIVSEHAYETEFVVLAPTEANLLIIQAVVVDGTWAGVSRLFSRILDGVQITGAAA
jgi:hypothetical protein